jgi:sarcosine oxidase subunit beta
MGSKTPGGARRGETVGSGTIRAQFPTETEVRFSLEAIGAFERFPEEFGVDIGYRKIGYLFLVGEAEDLLGYRQRMAMQRRLGVDVREITPAEAKAIVPALRVDDLVAAVWGSAGWTKNWKAHIQSTRVRRWKLCRRV